MCHLKYFDRYFQQILLSPFFNTLSIIICGFQIPVSQRLVPFSHAAFFKILEILRVNKASIGGSYKGRGASKIMDYS